MSDYRRFLLGVMWHNAKRRNLREVWSAFLEFFDHGRAVRQARAILLRSLTRGK